MSAEVPVCREFGLAPARALARLRKSAPRRGYGWVEDVLRSLSRERPEAYHRLSRTLYLGERLGRLAGLPEDERAAVALGLFFHALCDGASLEDGPRAETWGKYLSRHEAWVEPSLSVARAAARPDWEEAAGGMRCIVARTAVALESERSPNVSGSLDFLRSLRERTKTPDAERVVQSLWSEEGQNLCNWHLRAEGRPGEIDPQAIKEPIRVLAAVHGPRRAGKASESGGDETSSPQTAGPSSGNFDQRRRALSRAVAPKEMRGSPNEPEQDGHAAEDQLVNSVLREGSPLRRPAQAAEKAGAADAIGEEEAMRTHAETPVTQPGSSPGEVLTDLRDRLRQIEELAGQAQTLIAELEPGLDRASSMLDEVDALVQRWKG